MKTTDLIIILLGSVISISDIVLVLLHTPTYSQRLKWWGHRVSFIPFFFGVLGGHFFGALNGVLPWQITVFWILFIGLGLTAIHTMIMEADRQIGKWMAVTAYIPAGIVTGVFLWVQ